MPLCVPQESLEENTEVASSTLYQRAHEDGAAVLSNKLVLPVPCACSPASSASSRAWVNCRVSPSHQARTYIFTRLPRRSTCAFMSEKTAVYTVEVAILWTVHHSPWGPLRGQNCFRPHLFSSISPTPIETFHHFLNPGEPRSFFKTVLQSKPPLGKLPEHP